MILKNKKILIVNNQGLDECGGGVTIVKTLIDYFSQNNQVTFISESKIKPLVEKKNVQISNAKIKTYENKGFLWRFSSVLSSRSLKIEFSLSKKEYDFVIVLDCKYFFAINKAFPNSTKIYISLSAIPIVAIKDSNDTVIQKILIFLQYAFLERYAFQKADIPFVSSKTHLNEVMKYELITKKPHVVYPLIFSELREIKSECYKTNKNIRESLGIEGKHIALTVSRITKLKNIEYIIKIAEKIQRDDLVFLILGDGGHKKTIEEIICAKKLENRVILCGQQDDPEQFYKISDLYIHPSYYESFCCSIYEAMEFALPVIFPKTNRKYVSSFQELLKENEAFCVNFKRLQNVINSINALLDKKELREQTSAFALKRARLIKKKYGSYAQQIEKLICDKYRYSDELLW